VTVSALLPPQVLPEIRLDVERLKRVRASLIFILQRDGPKLPAQLEKDPGKPAGANWNGIVDELVSNKRHNVHMRMNFAAKCTDCECKIKKISLDECQNVNRITAPCRFGYIFTPSFYHVTDVLGVNGAPDDFDTAFCMKDTGVIYQLRRTSIRPTDETMVRERLANAPKKGEEHSL
jgi:hypothetical protein